MTLDTAWSLLVVLWLVTAVVVTIFPLAYLLSRWWTTPEGRAIMARSWAMALLVDQAVIFYFWDTSLWTEYVFQAATLSFTIFAASYLAYVLIRDQVRGVRPVPRSRPRQ